jgi:hypothetical protein
MKIGERTCRFSQTNAAAAGNQETSIARTIRISLAGAVLAIAPGILSAAPLIIAPGGGNVSISNLAGTMVGVSSSPPATACIDFGFSSNDACQTATGVLDSVSSGDNTLFTSGTGPNDTIKNLPLGTASLTNFETIQGPSNVVHFDLTQIVLPGALGNCSSNAANNQCAPGGQSPFKLVEDATGTQVTVTFSVRMNAYTGSSATGTTPYIGLFSTNLSGNLPNGSAVNITDILSYEASGGVISSTWSAQESALPSTPEPQSAWMVIAGIGMMAFGLAKRKSRQTRTNS